MMKKRILLTGGRGFLGSHVFEELIKAGYDKELIFCPSKSEFDLTKEIEVDRLFENIKPQIVIHVAADIGGIGYSRENPGKQLYNNLMMNTLLHDRAYRNKCEKFVGVGTVCSYPKYTPTPFKEEDLWIGYPEETNAAYGLSKKIMMEQSKAYRQQYQFNGVHLLMINLYGPRDNFDMETSHVIPAIIRKVEKAKISDEKEIVLWGDGTPTREFIYVEDAAKAIVLAMENYDSSEPVNIGSGQEISIADLAEMIAVCMGYRGKIVYDVTKPNGQPRRKLDVAKAKERFGFEAKVTFEEGIKKTIEWYYSNRDKLKI